MGEDHLLELAARHFQDVEGAAIWLAMPLDELEGASPVEAWERRSGQVTELLQRESSRDRDLTERCWF